MALESFDVMHPHKIMSLPFLKCFKAFIVYKKMIARNMCVIPWQFLSVLKRTANRLPLRPQPKEWVHFRVENDDRNSAGEFFILIF